MSTDLVKEYLSDLESETLLKSITDAITSQKFKLVDVVQALASEIVNEDDMERVKGLQCLSSIITNLPQEQLSESEIGHLMTFCTKRFDDVVCLKQVLEILEKLTKATNFNMDTDAKTILMNFTDNYNSKNYSASIRHLALLIVTNLNDKILQDSDKYLNEFNDSFIQCFLNVAAGEKDPKNLMCSFKLIYQIFTRFGNLAHFKEDLFDISFCYFPIAFKPPKSDPYKITPQELKLSLRAALCANEIIVDDLLPNLFEKLSSNSKSVKLDVLETIMGISDTYSEEVLNTKWPSIWDSLKYELLHDTEPEYDAVISLLDSNSYSDVSAAAVLTVFHKILRRLSQTHRTSAISAAVEELTKNTKKYKKQIFLLLSALARVDFDSFNLVVSKALPIVLNTSGLSVDEQATNIEIISFFSKGYKSLVEHYEGSGLDEQENEFLSAKDKILVLHSQCVISSSSSALNLKKKALGGFQILVSSNNFLNAQEYKMVLSIVTDLLRENLNDSNVFNKIYDSCLQVLLEVSKKSTDLISTEFLSIFLSELFEVNSNQMENILTILTQVCSGNHLLVEILSIRLLSKSDLSDRQLSLILKALFKTLMSFLSSNSEFKLHTKFVSKYLPLLMQHLPRCENDSNFEQISRIIYVVLYRSDLQHHQQVMDECMAKFVEGKDSNTEFFKNCESFNLLQQATRYSNVFFKILAALDYTKAKLSIEPKALVAQVIALLSTKKTDIYSKLGYLQLITVVVNKWYLESDYEEMAQEIKSIAPIAGENDFSSKLGIFTWLTKALVLRNSKYGVQFTQELLSLITTVKDDAEKDFVSRSFEILVSDDLVFQNDCTKSSEEKAGKKMLKSLKSLKSKNHNIVSKPLYKQQFFELVVPDLLKKFKEASSYPLEIAMIQKEMCLTILSLVSRHMPASVVLSSLQSYNFFPLLIEGTKILDSGVRSAALTTLSLVISQQTSNSVSGHLSSLIAILTQCFKSSSYLKRDFTNGDKIEFDEEFMKHNSVQVRERSLECLTKIASIVDRVKLMPFKEKLVKDLVVALDDSKRSVRKRAVECRQKYIEL